MVFFSFLHLCGRFTNEVVVRHTAVMMQIHICFVLQHTPHNKQTNLGNYLHYDLISKSKMLSYKTPPFELVRESAVMLLWS